MREKPNNVTAKDGSALPSNPFRDLRVRQAIDLAIDRNALAEVAMEGLGAPVNQMVTPTIFGFNKALPARRYDPAEAKRLLTAAGYPNGFKMQFSFTSDRLPGDREVGTAIAQMLAAIGIDAQPNAMPAAVFFPARTRGELSVSMSGWGTLTGEAHYTLSSLAHSNDRERRMGAFNVLAYNNPAEQAAAGRRHRDGRGQAPPPARGGQRPGRCRQAAPADRRGLLGLGDEQGQGHPDAACRRGHAGDGHPSGALTQSARGGRSAPRLPRRPTRNSRHDRQAHPHPGAGAIGGTLGAYWARAGLDVLLVDQVAEHVEACRTRGLHISGPIEDFTQVVPAATPGEVTGTFDIIVLAVKAQATEAALAQLTPHLSPNGYVLSAQNGLNELTIAKAVGAERTMGCFVNFGADWHGPGEVLFGNRAAVVVGEIDGFDPRADAGHA